MGHRRDLHRGFTLIELLVVIAIIALLAAILFPVFARARENARRSSCQSNLKQIGLGVMQYVQDFDERLPMGEIVPWYAPDKACAKAVAEATGSPILWKNFDNQSGTLLWMAVVYSYTKSTQIFYCPSGPTSTEATNWTAAMRKPDFAFGYAYNPIILQQWQWTDGVTFENDTCEVTNPARGSGTTRISQITQPASVALMMDRGQMSRAALECVDPVNKSHTCSCSHGGGAQALNVTGWASGNDDKTVSPTQGFNPSARHFEGPNVLYADGHVKWLSYEAYLAAKPGILNAGVS